jgi:FKBP-type peptidyl-prolyl cis-trans isomerase FkpA
MSKLTVILFVLCGILAGCAKSDTVGLAAIKAQAVIDDGIITAYLAAHPGLNAKRVDAAGADTSGVYYIIKQTGTGANLFTNSTQVTVADTGRLLTSGQIFTETNTFHPTYVLSSVILGWQVGIPRGQAGGIIRLLIPSRYGYGPNAQPTLGGDFGLPGGLPANAVLDFDIQLFNVVN